MTDDPHSTTGVLKKHSPFWWWVRGNPALVLTIMGAAASGLYTWHDVKTRLTAIEGKVDDLTKKAPEVTKSDFAELRDDVAIMRGRWEQVDSVPVLKVGHRGKHSP